MELKLGDAITQEVMDEIKLVADSLETAKGQIVALETQIETDAKAFEARVNAEIAKFKKGGMRIGADVHKVVADIKEELGDFSKHVGWDALFKKHGL